MKFKVFQTEQKVTISTIKDTADEGNESFKLNLYKDLASSNNGGTPNTNNGETHSAGFIKDIVAPSIVILLFRMPEQVMRQW